MKITQQENSTNKNICTFMRSLKSILSVKTREARKYAKQLRKEKERSRLFALRQAKQQVVKSAKIQEKA